MAQEVLIYFSLVIVLAAAAAIIMRMMKQPPIIAYLLAGVAAGPLIFNFIGVSGFSSDIIQMFARIGVALLLFIVGLSLDLRLLKEIGKVSTITGIAEVLVVGALGTGISIWLGFSAISALYIGVAFAFSSTVVVVKILSDKREMETLHGRISLGILIIQDILASLALMIVPLINSGGNSASILQKLGLAALMILAVFLASKFIFGRFMNYLAKSQETLFLFGIAWALILAALFYKTGFSMEIGALIAGMSLASSKYALDLEGKMKPLRDFFIVLFFVFFGSQLASINKTILANALVLSAFVMIIKPLVVMITLKIFGYTKRTNFLASLSLAQVSEFSLIIMLLGFSLGHINQEIMSLAILVALFTIGLSAYTINFSDKIANKLLRFLNIFDGRKYGAEERKAKHYEIFLFGYHRMGHKILNAIKGLNANYLVVDYNPKVVASLIERKIDCVYGDAGSKNFLYDIGIGKAKIIISTIPQEDINLAIKEVLKEIGSDAAFIATAEQPRVALDLYNSGADYVIIPHHLGADFASHMIKKLGMEKTKYARMGREHKRNLNESKRKSNFDD